MESSTILMMVIVLGVLWGGFAGLLIRSMQAERRRKESPRSSVAAAGPGGSGGHATGGTDV